MRGSFLVAFALAFAAIAACASFGDATPASPASEDAGPTLEAGTVPTNDAGGIDATIPSTGCAGADASVCFDFDTSSPSGAPTMQAAASITIEPDGSNHVLTATVGPNPPTGQDSVAYYPVLIPGAPSTVHWKFDVLLGDKTVADVNFMQIDSMTCSFQPELVDGTNANVTMTLVEACSGSEDAPLTSVPVTRNGDWWTFEFTVDFVNRNVNMSASDKGESVRGPQAGFPVTISNANLKMDVGIGYAGEDEANAVYTFDNFFLYY